MTFCNTTRKVPREEQERVQDRHPEGREGSPAGLPRQKGEDTEPERLYVLCYFSEVPWSKLDACILALVQRYHSYPSTTLLLLLRLLLLRLLLLP